MKFGGRIIEFEIYGSRNGNADGFELSTAGKQAGFVVRF
jgi:hypothetical protein